MTRKAIAQVANELVVQFSQVGPLDNPAMESLVTCTQEKLAARQIAPQNIIKKFVKISYNLILQEKIKINDETFQVLKEMEKLARERSFLPFRRYDPWN